MVGDWPLAIGNWPNTAYPRYVFALRSFGLHNCRCDGSEESLLEKQIPLGVGLSSEYKDPCVAGLTNRQSLIANRVLS